jgi:multiple antibiotic resistance protein
MDYQILIANTIYFLALINPVSKVFLLSSLNPSLSHKELFKVSLNSSFAAFIILSLFTAAGLFLFKSIFKIDLYSLKVAGGIVLSIIGFRAVTRGVFYEKAVERKISSEVEFSVVPLGAPLIAGPGTITGAISLSSEQGFWIAIVSLSIALLVNFFFMLGSFWIGKGLQKIHAIGAVIRITGLVVSAIAVQMIFNGLREWILLLLKFNS